jgi:hypothetical protein
MSGQENDPAVPLFRQEKEAVARRNDACGDAYGRRIRIFSEGQKGRFER